MNVLVLGGTGTIGGAVVEALRNMGASVTVLCRSLASIEKAQRISTEVSVIEGDISDPSRWLGKLDQFDAVVHAACGFGADMSVVDTRLMSSLISYLSTSQIEKTLIYTGGTWCYGEGGKQSFTEASEFFPPPEFSWLAENSLRVQNSPYIRGITVHPGIVVDDPQGMPSILIEDFQNSGELNIPCSEDLTWPIVGRQDLASAYCLALEKGVKGQSYNIAGIEAASVLNLSRVLASRNQVNHPTRIKPTQYWTDRYGDSARGYGYSQRLVSNRARETLGWRPRLTSIQRAASF